MQTLQDIKDEVAKADGFDDWEDYIQNVQYSPLMNSNNKFNSIQDAVEDMDSMINSIAKEYAEQFINEAAKVIDNTSVELYLSEYKELEGVILSLKNELK